MTEKAGPTARRAAWLGAASAALLASTVLAACSSGGSSGGTGGKITISADLPPETGPITAADNKGLLQLTNSYEKAHPNVTIDWHVPTSSGITDQNTLVITRANGGDDEDLIWEQNGPVNGGAIPSGILANLGPYLNAADPYDKSVATWLDSFQPADIPYMKNESGTYQIINSSDVATGIYYSKADFAKAGITSVPTTWAGFITDLGTLKKAGITPFLFADGGLCNPEWWEETLQTTLLAPQVSQIDFDHATVLSSKDYATGVGNGVISMSNPRYAEIWKLLGTLRPYLAQGGSGYDACGSSTTTTPPLWGASLLIKGQVAMVWEDSPAGPHLNQQGFNGQWGTFQLPNISTADTPLASGVNPTGVIGGPNGAGDWAVTTQQADSSMTPAKTKQVVDFLEYLTAPQNLSVWLPISSGGPAFIPLVKGASAPGTSQLTDLLPAGKVPTAMPGLLGDQLTEAGANSGLRLLQSYLNGSASYSSFATQWEALLKQSAQQWAQQNNATIPGVS